MFSGGMPIVLGGRRKLKKTSRKGTKRRRSVRRKGTKKRSSASRRRRR